MTSPKKVAFLVLLTSLTVSSVRSIQAQQRRTTTTSTPSYTLPPPPRPDPPRPAPRNEPTPESRPQYTPQYTPRNVEPENRPSNKVQPPETRLYNNVQQPENHPYNNNVQQPQSRPAGNIQPENRPNPGLRHANVNIVRPQVVTPTLRHAMTYNTRPNGVHILPDYFAAHYGYSHGFHFNGWGPGCPTCGFTPFNGEWYFNWNGGNFGVIGQIPGNWALGTDYLYVDIGDHGNYYLYDTKFPDVAIQLTFVLNIGDDQAGDGQDQDDQIGSLQ